MTSVFNLTNGKRIVEESEIKDVLLHVSNEEVLTLVEDFIMNYDVTLDELSFLLEWLRRNKVETPQLHISEECLYPLIYLNICVASAFISFVARDSILGRKCMTRLHIRRISSVCPVS